MLNRDAWDAGNCLTQIVDSISGTITRTYDGLDRLTQEATPQGTVSYTYDAAGRPRMGFMLTWLPLRFVLVLICGTLLAGAAPQANLSTPERTIETYYLGYKTANKGLIIKTLLAVRDVSDLGLGIDNTYEIMEKKLVLFSKLAARRDDIEIVVYVTFRWPDGDRQMITTFILRKINREWKIAGYDSSEPGTKSAD